MRFTLILSGTFVAGLTASVVAQGDSRAFDGFEVAVESDGKIFLPTVPFRSEWTSLGTFVVNGGEDGAEGFHSVYTQPDVVQAYLETGSFPDGTVLIKELLGTRTEELTTGNVSYAHGVEGWFVMVKDQNGRYPDNALWGDGWGWGYFSAEDPNELITADYKAECLDCHLPAQDTDWIYIRGYPQLSSP